MQILTLVFFHTLVHNCSDGYSDGYSEADDLRGTLLKKKPATRVAKKPATRTATRSQIFALRGSRYYSSAFGICPTFLRLRLASSELFEPYGLGGLDG